MSGKKDRSGGDSDRDTVDLSQASKDAGKLDSEKGSAATGAEQYDGEILEGLRRERDEYYDLLLRKQAEFENFRKRVSREKQDLRVTCEAELIVELLPVVDACEKGLEAIQAAPPQGEVAPYVEGYELLLKQLKSFLEKHGVSEIAGVGTEFDPNYHEAVLREVGCDHRDNLILEQYRKGYLIGERLLRPSQVKVAIQPEDSCEDSGQQGE